MYRSHWSKNLLRFFLSLKYSSEDLTLINFTCTVDTWDWWAFSEVDSDTDIIASLCASASTESAVVSYCYVMMLKV